jgi:hypothetical protein
LGSDGASTIGAVDEGHHASIDVSRASSLGESGSLRFFLLLLAFCSLAPTQITKDRCHSAWVPFLRDDAMATAPSAAAEPFVREVNRFTIKGLSGLAVRLV